MSKEIDGESIALLRDVRGKLLVSVSGLRYTGVLGYSSVRLNFSDGRGVTVTLRSEDVSENAEVFVPVLKAASETSSPSAQDQFKVDAFRVSRVYRLQRREVVEWSAPEANGYVGTGPREMSILEIDEGVTAGEEIVDAGVAFESEDGLLLELYADTFPLILQLRLTVAASVVPTPRRTLVA